MDFDFPDDQQQLRDAVRKWVDKGYNFERRRAIVARFAASTAPPTANWPTGPDRPHGARTARRHGPGRHRRHGGHGRAGPWHGARTPQRTTFIASSVLSLYAPADVQAAWLQRIASGEALAVLAHQERKARYRLDVCDAKRLQRPPDMR